VDHPDRQAASVSHEQAATLPLAALIAWQAVADYAALESGERVLVLGGAGGVGLFAVQLAAILGGHVTASGRGAGADLVRDLGAERFIAFDTPDAAEMPGELDVVIDTVGGAALDGSYGLLREGGRLVTLSAPPDQDRAAKRGIHAMSFVVAQDHDGLANLTALTDAGRLRTFISQTFPLAEGRQGFQSGAHRRPPGKTVLVIRP
jgi:NADPH:quinone reductase-like Zn-dependent oxidoreductase